MIHCNELIFASYRRALMSRGRSEQTIESYRRALSELDGWSGRDVVALGKADIEGFLAARLSEVAASTVGIRYRSLRAFYSWCVSVGEMDRHPMNGTREPKNRTVAPDVLSDDDLRKLIKACGKNARDEAIVRILCEPGSPRLGELTSMTVESVDLLHDMITIDGKTGERAIPFGAKTGSALDRYMRARRRHRFSGLAGLWLGSKGVMGSSALAQMLARHSRNAGLGRINPHQLRHTSVSAWLESGGNETDAVQLFGWTSGAMLRVYGRSAAVSRAQKAARRASLGDRL